ncbi:MAG: TonB-dependent receptor [Chlorobiaceae bacterium]|nr:TonB-dependent receptor [Chlorobiaceae bacterium]
MNKIKTILYFFLISLGILFDRVFCGVEEPSDSAKIFYLGEIIIVGNGMEGSTPFQQDAIQQNEMMKQYLLNTSHALNILPGVNISNVGGRNESMVYVRGFDLRQIPVFLDGIPQYVPYDGYVDLARFTTFDLSRITINKGFSSILYGANAMGGAINLISRKPSSELDYEFLSGIMNSGGYNYLVNLGMNRQSYYLSGNISKSVQNSFPLSQSYTTTQNENGGERDNSYRSDLKYGIKTGYTPNETDEYTFSFMNQHGEKGNPVYSGANPLGIVRYWRWPNWDKISEYFISKTVFGDESLHNGVLVKTRFFHDKFKNTLHSYDDASYSTQSKKSSFKSYYNDDSWGAVLEGVSRILRNHQITIASYYKYDIHRENNFGEPARTISDAAISAGIEDVYLLREDVSLIGGVSYDLRKSLEAQDYNSKTNTLSDFPKDDAHALNIQIGGIYSISSVSKVTFGIARKTRFATMKDRYSYKQGSAIPNPYLLPEYAVNYDISYHEMIDARGFFKVSAFYNDIRNVIMQITNIQGTLSQMLNFGKARYFGAEAEFELNPIPFMNTGMNYTFLKRDNISDPGIKFLDTPEHKIFFYTTILPISTIDVTLGVEYNSPRYSTSDGLYNAPAYTIFDVKSSLTLFDHVLINFGVTNIFDRNYCIMEGYPEAGRTGYLNVRFSN